MPFKSQSSSHVASIIAYIYACSHLLQSVAVFAVDQISRMGSIPNSAFEKVICCLESPNDVTKDDNTTNTKQLVYTVRQFWVSFFFFVFCCCLFVCWLVGFVGLLLWFSLQKAL